MRTLKQIVMIIAVSLAVALLYIQYIIFFKGDDSKMNAHDEELKKRILSAARKTFQKEYEVFFHPPHKNQIVDDIQARAEAHRKQQQLKEIEADEHLPDPESHVAASASSAGPVDNEHVPMIAPKVGVEGEKAK